MMMIVESTDVCDGFGGAHERRCALGPSMEQQEAGWGELVWAGTRDV